MQELADRLATVIYDELEQAIKQLEVIEADNGKNTSTRESSD